MSPRHLPDSFVRRSFPAWSSAGLTAGAILAWEFVVLNGYGLSEIRDAPGFFASHLAVDLIILVPLLALAFRVGSGLARRYPALAGVRGSARGRTMTIGFSTLILSLIVLALMVPGAGMRLAAHGWLGNAAPVQGSTDLGPTSSYCSFAQNPEALPAQGDTTATSTARVSEGAWAQSFFIPGVRMALMDQALVLPFLLLLGFGRHAWRPRPFEMRRRWRVTAGLGLAAAAAVAYAGVLGNDPEDDGIAAENPPLAVARTFHVSAIPVSMTLNRFGDHDPDAQMYVLDERIPEVRAQEQRANPDRVSIGLRKDAIQPLVIRANLGETIAIHFTNRLASGPASLHLHGLPHTMENAAGKVGFNTDTTAQPGQTITYTIEIPDDPNAERAYYFRDHGASRQRVVRGLFGALVAEPAGSRHLDVETGEALTSNNWEAIIAPPTGPAFREFVLLYHEVGDENFDGIRDTHGRSLPVTDTISETYRPCSRAINYRSETFHNRLALKQDKSQGYGSYMFGDPATPMPRSYLGEPTKTRLLHGGSEIFHVHHLHGGGDRWRRNPKADPNNAISGGLTKRPVQNAFSTRLDSQSIGPGTSYNLEHEGGAGGVQQAAGDFLFHCHIGHHYLAGMWSFWRVFDTVQPGLFPVPGIAPAESGPSSSLAGAVVEGKTLVPEAQLTDPLTQRSLEAWVEAQLPPKGVPLDDGDATVWDWDVRYTPEGLPLYLGEPEDDTVWANYASAAPGERPVISFNLHNGRYAWPLFRPHLGQRPPFSPNGHSGAPWLGEYGSAQRPDGLWPDEDVLPIPDRKIRQYPITAITTPVQTSPDTVDEDGMVFVLGDEKEAVLSGARPAQPLAIRSNVGDGTHILLTSELDGTNPDLRNEKTANGDYYSKVNMHIHFVQFDPQASDGVITGMSYEQSVRPYATEGRELTAEAVAGSTVLQVNHTERLRPGIWIGIGLGAGMRGDRMATEIRKITDITPTTILLDQALELDHAPGEAVGVEFVRYAWYSDVDTGTVFWHDHVNFKSWDHGLFGAHIIEPAGSTYHDPRTGEEVRSGPIVDIHAPSEASIGDGQSGSFREFVLMMHNRTGGDFGADLVDSGASINLAGSPLAERGGNPAYTFSSVTHGDPMTPLPQAYVGDPFVIRHLGVVERVGAVRVSGHRFKLERWAAGGAISDASPIGISERFDLILEGGAGGPGGYPGDYLYYSTVGRDFLAGAWGIIRVHGAESGGLRPLPGHAPEPGDGAPADGFTGEAPERSTDPGDPGPETAPLRHYAVDISNALIVTGEDPLTYVEGIAFLPTPAEGYESEEIDGKPLVREPLIIRANRGDLVQIDLRNRLNQRASFTPGELIFDPQGSYGPPIGFNKDSTTLPGETRSYRFYADKELGTTFFLNLANVYSLDDGAFGGLIVEPEGSVHLDPYTGGPIKAGLAANIVSPSGNFREFVTLFHDTDGVIGQSRMPYPRDVEGFTGINYSAESLLKRRHRDSPGNVFSSIEHGDPRLVFEAHCGDPVTFRIAAPWGEQMHTFAMDGHRWPLEPGMTGSEQIYANLLAPGYTMDAPLVGGAGAAGDYLVQDGRLPFLEAGLWGILAVNASEYPHLQPLGEEDPGNPATRQRGEAPASRAQVAAVVRQDALDREAEDLSPIEIHSAMATVELEPGADRGLITLPLRKVTINSTGQLAWFVLSDTSDEAFAKAEGCLVARGLAEANPDAVEDASYRNGVWEFENDAGLVAHFDADGNVIPPSANPLYSPLKRIVWQGREIIVNAPLVKWGDAPGQQMHIDRGGIDPLIRMNPPSPFFVGGGPQGATPDEEPIDRYEGGQVTALRIEPGCDESIDTRGCASVTMKAQIAIHRRDFFAYYVVFETSKPPPAGFMGVPYAPKLAHLSSATDELWNNTRGFSKAVGHIMQFRNGVYTSGGGPKRFQPGLTSYASPAVNDYSPMWHITWLFWDCDQDGVFFNEDRNRSFGATPVAGSGIAGFDPAEPVTFNPFGMDDISEDCTVLAIAGTGNPDGRIYLGELARLKEMGLVVETQAPAGWNGVKLGPADDPTHPLNHPLIVNCPTHVLVDYRNTPVPALAKTLPKWNTARMTPDGMEIRFRLAGVTGFDAEGEAIVISSEILEQYQMELSFDLREWVPFAGEITVDHGDLIALLPPIEDQLFVRVSLK